MAVLWQGVHVVGVEIDVGREFFPEEPVFAVAKGLIFIGNEAYIDVRNLNSAGYVFLSVVLAARF